MRSSTTYLRISATPIQTAKSCTVCMGFTFWLSLFSLIGFGFDFWVSFLIPNCHRTWEMLSSVWTVASYVDWRCVRSSLSHLSWTCVHAAAVRFIGACSGSYCWFHRGHHTSRRVVRVSSQRLLQLPPIPPWILSPFLIWIWNSLDELSFPLYLSIGWIPSCMPSTGVRRHAG